MKRVGIILCVVALLLPCAMQAQAVELDVAGKSALLMDVQTGSILFARNEHEKLAPASVTKVMTMLLIMEAIDSGRIAWNDIVTASETAAAKGGSQVYLKVGETMTVSEMLKCIAVSSANDCACAMAEHIAGSERAFVASMNARAAELGMEDTHFVNCTGLDDGADAVEHRTSAYDIAIMSRELLKNHPDIKAYTTIWMDTIRDGAFGLSNTNKLIRFYSGATGLKTGYTSGAGYCLSASAERDGMELIAVVMGCATSKERTAACKTMLDHGFANYAVIEPTLPEPSHVAVTLGRATSVGVHPSQSDGILIDKAKKNAISSQVTLDESVPAPVSAGQRLGTLTIRAGEETIAEIPLVADVGIPRLTWGEIMLAVLRHVAMAREVEQ